MHSVGAVHNAGEVNWREPAILSRDGVRGIAFSLLPIWCKHRGDLSTTAEITPWRFGVADPPDDGRGGTVGLAPKVPVIEAMRRRSAKKAGLRKAYDPVLKEQRSKSAGTDRAVAETDPCKSDVVCLA